MLLAFTEGVHRKGIFASNASYLQQQNIKQDQHTAHCCCSSSCKLCLSIAVMLLGACGTNCTMCGRQMVSCAGWFVWQHSHSCPVKLLLRILRCIVLLLLLLQQLRTHPGL
jgi:hypothetical protein